MKFLRGYRFNICFENASHPGNVIQKYSCLCTYTYAHINEGYCTEKILHAFAAGCVWPSVFVIGNLGHWTLRGPDLLGWSQCLALMKLAASSFFSQSFMARPAQPAAKWELPQGSREWFQEALSRTQETAGLQELHFEDFNPKAFISAIPSVALLLCFYGFFGDYVFIGWLLVSTCPSLSRSNVVKLWRWLPGLSEPCCFPLY